MAVIVSDNRNAAYNQYLSASDGFYRAEAYNLGMWNTTTLPVSTIRYINTTFANVSNIAGIVLGLYAIVIYNVGLSGVIVTLQENVVDVWTDRVSKELTCAEINPEHSQTGNSFVSFAVNFKFDTPYLVDTSVNKWRFKIEQGAGSVATWQLLTSDAINPSYVAYSNTQISANDDDTLIVADKIIIDKSITLKGLAATGETTIGVCGWICRSTDITEEGICLLEWDSTPASSYTLTLGGLIMVGSFSGFRVGTEEHRIPNAQQAIIVNKTTKDYGTTNSGFINPCSTTSSRSRAKISLFFYGEIPTKPYGILAQDASYNQAVCYTTEDLSSSWQPGDYVYVSRQNVKGQGTVVWQQIQSISGTQITLTSNLLSYNRLEGGTIINRNRGYGIVIKGTSGNNYLQLYFEHPNYLKISGVQIDNAVLGFNRTTSYYNYPSLPANRSKYIIEDNIFIADSISAYALINGVLIPPEGADIKRNIAFRVSLVSSLYAYYTKTISTNPFYSGTLTFSDNRIYAFYSGAMLAGTTNYKVIIENNVIENSLNSSAVFQINGLGTIFRNNYIFGCGTVSHTVGPAIWLNTCINGRFSGNTIRNCVNGYGGIGIGNLIDIKSINDIFIDNTTDIAYYGTNYYDVTFESPTGELKFDNTYITDSISSSNIKIINENDVANTDSKRTPIGIFTRCGYNLSDTTTHTSGDNKFSLRFQSISETSPLTWEQFIPTGDIQNKTMEVSVWVKINNANYYAGTHILPTLSITYDNDVSTSSSIATESTDWQLITVSFTPITSYGRIKVSISGATDAVGNDAYFYIDDMNIIFPSTNPVNIGDMDLWVDGMPLTPSIILNEIKHEAIIYHSTLYNSNIY